MSKGINKVILIGNLGAEPEVRQAPSGDAIATLSVATSERWKDRQTGQPVEKTEWHRVVAFGRLAEVIRDYLRKGSKIYVEGQLRTRKWQDQSGVDRYTTEIVARDLQMLDAAPGAGASQAPAQRTAPRPVRQAADHRASHNNADWNDDIPF